MNILEEFETLLGDRNVLKQEDLSKHTSLRIGGPAKYFLLVDNVDKLIKVLDLCEENHEPYYILGNGSNVLASDSGFDGVIIKLTGDFDKVTASENTINAGSSAMLSVISKIALENSLTGLEFASGIPGTLGGALVMNAGAYGGEMRQVVSTVNLLEAIKEGNKNAYVRKTYTLEQMKFDYRYSIAKEKKVIFLSAEMLLEKGDKDVIRASMDEMNKSRREKQPLEYPSAGSTFKRPAGYFAGKLISDAGLKGYNVNGAEVSEKHAGFCINKGGATAADFKQLMQDVSDKVYELYSVRLEPEVIVLAER